MILGAIGLRTGSRLLLSSQAVAILLVGAAWTADLAPRLLPGSHLLGGTEYMWDPQSAHPQPADSSSPRPGRGSSE